MWQSENPRLWVAGGTPEIRREAMTESEIIVLDGELLCGVLDKSSIGSTCHGLVHACYDVCIHSCNG